MKSKLIIILVLMSILAKGQVPSWTNMGPFHKIKSLDGTKVYGGHAFCGKMQIVSPSAGVNHFYVGTGAGLFKSTDNCATFINVIPQTEPARIHTILAEHSPFYVHPRSTGDIIITCSEYSYYAGPYLSENGGSTWTSFNTGLPPINEDFELRDFKPDPLNSNFLYAASTAGIYVLDLTNVSQGWKRDVAKDPSGIVSSDRFSKVETRFVSSTNYSVYAQTEQGKMYEKKNTGNWTAMLSTGLPAYVKDDRYSFATRGSVLYLIRETPVSGGGQTDLNGSIYKYDFTTNSWSLRTGSYVTGTGYGGGTYGAKVDPVNLNKVYVPHERLRIYNDVSQTFKEESNYELLKTENCANIHADFNDLEFASNDNTTLYSTNDGFVSAYKINSTDNLLCDAWLPINGAGLNGLDAYTVNSSVDLPNTVLVSNWHNPTCLYDGNISTQADQFRALGVLSDFTENYGPNFFYKGNKFLGLPSNGNYYKWCEKSGTTLAISDFILKTTLNPNGDFVYPTMLNPPVRHVNDPYQIFIGQAQVYKSLYINSGTDNKFEEVSSFPSDESVTHIATSFSNPNNLFVGTAKDSAVYKSDGSFSTYLKIPYLYKVNHNTKAWTKISFNFPRRGLGIEGIAVNSINENNIIINIDRSMIYETLDGGITWSVISGVGKLSSSFYYTLTAEKGTNGRFLIATKNGIFYKDADNPTWQSYGVNFPGIILWSIDVNYSFNTLYAAASQAGIWKAPLICPSQANRTIMYRLHTYYEAQKLFVDNALSEPNFNLQLRGSESIVLTNATFAPDYGRSVMGYIHGCNPTSVPSGTFYRQEEVAENNEMASPDEKSESDMISGTEGIKISPNPSTGPIKVESKLNQGENFQYLQISDINGKIVFETKKYETAINVELNPSQTSYYLVSFVTDKRKVVKKVVTPINGADPNQDYSFKKRN